jgi:ketosteroid isomerase-like protein
MTTMQSTTAADLAAGWTRFWNGDLALAAELLDADFRIHFGAPSSDAPDRVRGPEAMAAFVADYRETRGDVRFQVDGPPAGADGRIAFVWSAALPDGRAVSGIDLATLVDGRLAEVWSVTGARVLPPVPAA